MLYSKQISVIIALLFFAFGGIHSSLAEEVANPPLVKPEEINNTSLPSVNIEEQDFEAMLIQVLEKNPEIVIDAIKAYQDEEAMNVEKHQGDGIAMLNKIVHSNPDLPAIGASFADAKVTMIEFFDYQCGYCKRLYPHLEDLISKQKDLRIVLIELPILGDDSDLAARAAIAAAKQDKYQEYHHELMSHKGRLSDDLLIETAEKLKLDMAQFNLDRKDKLVDRMVLENIKLAQQLGIKGTPALIIGDNLIPGYIEKADIEDLIMQERKKGSDKSS